MSKYSYLRKLHQGDLRNRSLGKTSIYLLHYKLTHSLVWEKDILYLTRTVTIPTGTYYLGCTSYTSPEGDRAALYEIMSPDGAQA